MRHNFGQPQWKWTGVNLGEEAGEVSLVGRPSCLGGWAWPPARLRRSRFRDGEKKGLGGGYSITARSRVDLGDGHEEATLTTGRTSASSISASLALHFLGDSSHSQACH